MGQLHLGGFYSHRMGSIVCLIRGVIRSQILKVVLVLGRKGERKRGGEGKEKGRKEEKTCDF